MGGTGWSYFVPYQVDFQKALDALRQDVFSRGDYERIDVSDVLYGYKELYSMGITTATDEQERQDLISQYGMEPLLPLIDRIGIGGLREELHALAEASVLSSLADLEALRCLSTDGTHSILDIREVEPVPRFGVLAPMPPEQVTAIFGTDTPTHEMVKQADYQGKIDAGPRWQALSLTVYKDGNPDEIFISGSSGD